MLFSIIIPILNRANYLPRLFASLSQIDTEGVEVLLVDNGSTDNSLHLCRDFQREQLQKGLSVQVLSQEKPSASSARNLGASVAKGQYLYFFDSDDEFDPHFLRDAQPLIGTADLLSAPTLMIFPDGSTKKRAMPRGHLLLGHLLAGSFSTQSCLIKHDFWDNFGGWNENLRQWDDWELGARLLLHHPVVNWLPATAYHRIYQHKESQTGAPLGQVLPFYKKALLEVEEQLLRSGRHKSERHGLLRAVKAKALLLCGIAHRQGEKELAKSLSEATLKWFSNPLIKGIFRGIYQYDSCGGRGTWRIYYLLCRLFLSVK